MARYTPELIASVRHEYENTDKSVRRIATDHAISHRGIYRLRDRGGWLRRNDRVRDLPPAMLALREAAALLAKPASADDDPTPDRLRRSDPPLSGEGERMTTIERIERLVQRELQAEEAVRAQLGPVPRPAADAERCARTLATLTQTLHALARLRSGLPAESGLSDDDMPRDIDEFRRELARRIRVFVESRIAGRLRDGVPAADAADGKP
jgi:hypothetical protein